MVATSSTDLVHTQVHPRRPRRAQGPRPSVHGSEGRRRKKSQLLQAPDIWPQPGHPAPSPGNPEHANQRAEESGNSSPDIRPPARTSGTYLCAENGPRAHVSPSHLPLRGLTLYILPHLLLVRVSVGLAHWRDRASLIHIGSTPRERLRPLRRRSTLDSRPLTGRSPCGLKTSSRRRTGYLLYRPLLTLDLVSSFVFMDLAHV